MKLVTISIDWSRLEPEYVAGKCNIGSRGRAIRLSNGAILIGLSVILGLTVLRPLFWAVRLVLIVPIAVGFIAALEGSMSFCVVYGLRGTYDLHEPLRTLANPMSGSSQTLNRVGSEDWKKIDRRNVKRMVAEALVGAVLLGLLLALA